MYLGIDIGGTKTLLAVYTEAGELSQKLKFPTSKKYAAFLDDLMDALKQLGNPQVRACCCALTAIIDRKKGIGITFGNLKWKNVAVKDDLKQLLGGIPVLIENDSKLAGLHEGILLQKRYKKILYLTLGTGIGSAVVTDGKLDEALLSSEAGHMVLNHNGKLEKWETFASGRAIVARYGKKAAEITDPAIWKTYAKDVAQGLDPLIAAVAPDAVVFGGGVGSHFDKFGHFLREELQKYKNNMVPIPPLLEAQKPEEAVIYGCYDYIKQNI